MAEFGGVIERMKHLLPPKASKQEQNTSTNIPRERVLSPAESKKRTAIQRQEAATQAIDDYFTRNPEAERRRLERRRLEAVQREVKSMALSSSESTKDKLR